MKLKREGVQARGEAFAGGNLVNGAKGKRLPAKRGLAPQNGSLFALRRARLPPSIHLLFTVNHPCALPSNTAFLYSFESSHLLLSNLTTPNPLLHHWKLLRTNFLTWSRCLLTSSREGVQEQPDLHSLTTMFAYNPSQLQT